MYIKYLKHFNFNKLLLGIVFKKKYPLAISWAITKRCNMHCLYCVGGANEDELTTEQITKIITDTSEAGVKFISFTGGEPLLREDIKDIIKCAKDKGIFVKLNTNGYLLEEKINDINNVDIVHLSLDGNECINDYIRSKGSYGQVLEGLKIALKKGIKISLNTVISRLNVEHLPEIVQLANTYNLPITFQPATKNLFRNDKPNPVAPDTDKHKKAIEYIIKLKKTKPTNRLILNSTACLRHLYNWPTPKLIPCYAGILSFRIDSKGNLYNCDESNEKGVNILQHGFRNCIDMLKPSPCSECWGSSHIDFNFLMSLELNSLIDTLPLLFKRL